MLAPSQGAPAEIAKKAELLRSKMEEYKSEQAAIKAHAEAAQEDAELGSKINDRCDQASLALQIAIVIASVSILASSRAFWILSVVLGVVGSVIGVMAFLI